MSWSGNVSKKLAPKEMRKNEKHKFRYCGLYSNNQTNKQKK